jgi:LysM repeat protein
MKTRFSFVALLLAAVTLAALFLAALPTTVAASSEYPTGPYWYGEYFDARWPTARPVLTRRDPSISFDWGTGSPDSRVPVDNFSARWTRTVDFEGGVYKFWVMHDDGVLLYIDDQLAINQWYDQPAYMIYTHGPVVPNIHYEEVNLAPGAHRIKLEYYEHGKNAVIKLGWDRVDPTPSAYVPPPASTLETGHIHVVRPGEWLYKIGRMYNVSVQVIIQINGLTSGKVTPGQTLIIPGGNMAMPAANPSAASSGCQNTHVVKRGDNLFRISLVHKTTIASMAATNGLSAPYTVHVGQVLCVP